MQSTFRRVVNAAEHVWGDGGNRSNIDYLTTSPNDQRGQLPDNSHHREKICFEGRMEVLIRYIYRGNSTV